MAVWYKLIYDSYDKSLRFSVDLRHGLVHITSFGTSFPENANHEVLCLCSKLCFLYMGTGRKPAISISSPFGWVGKPLVYVMYGQKSRYKHRTFAVADVLICL